MGTLHVLHMRSEIEDSPEQEPGDLVAAAAHGDVAAFERLYRRYSARVYGLCLRMMGQREAAEDCTQECFVQAWRSLSRFERRSEFSTWLHAIAVRTVLSKGRGMRARFEVSEPDGGLPERADPKALPPPLDLERAVAQLPEAARHVLVLVGIYGYTHKEAGAALGIAEGTCKAQLHRARQLLAARLGVEES
jgi:DNA-directed RNA polymerase specialized sigma24 family protein